MTITSQQGQPMTAPTVLDAPPKLSHTIRKLSALRRAGQLPGAEQLARDLVTRFPHQGTPHVALGRILLADDRPDEALSELDAACSIAPDDFRPAYWRAITLSKLGLWQLAEAQTYDLLRRRPPVRRRILCPKGNIFFMPKHITTPWNASHKS
jgi:Flp pilus assembly protein TadD